MSMQCYNRGCGKKFDEADNMDDACRHHPGEPVFHDAYKGWSCCKKKCTDFTEFLNIKGCALAKHSNVKPPEPVKPVVDVPVGDVIEVKPIVPSSLTRPNYNTPLALMKPTIAASLQAELANPKPVETLINGAVETGAQQRVHIGTTCKNGGCGMTFDGEDADSTECIFHPGVPIFHEGLKFWSCCQKRTTDFSAFLAQPGCDRGNHCWIKEDKKTDGVVTCRWDHHQTGSHVVVSIYAKNYCPTASTVQLNPIRLRSELVFPQEVDGGAFLLDLELKGIVDVAASAVNMYGTKVEIKLKKAEPGSWSRLDVPRPRVVIDEPESRSSVEDITPQVDAVDLSEL